MSASGQYFQFFKEVAQGQSLGTRGRQLTTSWRNLHKEEGSRCFLRDYCVPSTFRGGQTPFEALKATNSFNGWNPLSTFVNMPVSPTLKVGFVRRREANDRPGTL